MHWQLGSCVSDPPVGVVNTEGTLLVYYYYGYCRACFEEEMHTGSGCAGWGCCRLSAAIVKSNGDKNGSKIAHSLIQVARDGAVVRAQPLVVGRTC